MKGTHILHFITEHAQNYPDRLALRFLKDGNGGYESFTWSDVLRLAQQGLATLRHRGLKQGDRVLLALPTGEAFVAGVLGALWGGIIPATLALPSKRLSNPAFEVEWRVLVSLFAPSAIITEMALFQTDVPRITPDELLKSTELPFPVEEFSDPDQIAYVQFTSGSTGRPRGAALSLKAICANLEAMKQRLQLTPEDQGVSWLPMYHDMGFIGAFLLPLYCGFPVTLMDSSLFVANPRIWLKTMAEIEATITPVPPSALQICLDLIQRRSLSHLDLSSAAHILVGSERVSPRLIQNFHKVLGLYGASQTALKPSYGLAEATLAVTVPLQRQLPRVDWIRGETLEVVGKAIQTTPETQGAQGWVSAGIPLKGIHLRITSRQGEPLPDRQVGHILVKSPSLMTAALENGIFYPRQGEWLDTGDLGYLAEGELFITGRWRDIIIKRGRNYSPERLEDLATLAEGVHRAAAFSFYDNVSSTEKVILLIEPQSKSHDGINYRDRIRLDVRSHLRSAGYEVDEVHIVPRGSLPRTTSGKIRRQHCRELFLQNVFKEENS